MIEIRQYGLHAIKVRLESQTEDNVKSVTEITLDSPREIRRFATDLLVHATSLEHHQADAARYLEIQKTSKVTIPKVAARVEEGKSEEQLEDKSIGRAIAPESTPSERAKKGWIKRKRQMREGPKRLGYRRRAK